MTINNDAIGFYATGSLEKCGRTVFEIVSSTDDFEIIKKWDYPSCQIVTVISLSINYNLKQIFITPHLSRIPWVLGIAKYPKIKTNFIYTEMEELISKFKTTSLSLRQLHLTFIWLILHDIYDWHNFSKNCFRKMLIEEF